MIKKYDIFISHAKEDNKLALALCHFLEQNRFRCWMAPRDVQAGKDYAACIIDGIQSSRIMVVILSEYSNKSHHVRNEVERAFNHQVAILPFRIRDVIPEQSLEYFLSSYHWLDAIDGQAESYFDDLYRHCFALLNSDQDFEQSKPPVNRDTKKSEHNRPERPRQKDSLIKPQSYNGLLYTGGAVILALLLFFLLIKPLFEKNTIEFKNNSPAPIYLDVDGKIDTIRTASSFNFTARKNTRIKTKAYSYWTNIKGEILGTKIQWSIDTVVHADGNFTYPLYVNSNFFFLKVINNSTANINYITVNTYNSDDKYTMNIKIPNDGVMYSVGYFKILPNTKIEIWNVNNYYLNWTNGSNLRFSDSYNQSMLLKFQ